MFSPRHFVATEGLGSSWWYVLWHLPPSGEWKYALFEYLSAPGVIRFHPRVGLVRGVGHMINHEWYLMLEKVVLEDQDPDRIFYWAIYHRVIEGHMMRYEFIFGFYSAAEAVWEG